MHMRESEKRMLFFGSKKTDFYIKGHTLNPIVFDFLYFFIEEKNFAILKIYIFLRVFFRFFIFLPFFPFDLFRRNLTLVLITKGRLSTAYLP